MKDLLLVVNLVDELCTDDRVDVMMEALKAAGGVEPLDGDMRYPGLESIDPLFILCWAVSSGGYLVAPLRDLYDDLPNAYDVAVEQRDRTVKMLGKVIAKLARV